MGIDVTSLKTIRMGFIMPHPACRLLSAWFYNQCERPANYGMVS